MTSQVGQHRYGRSSTGKDWVCGYTCLAVGKIDNLGLLGLPGQHFGMGVEKKKMLQLK